MVWKLDGEDGAWSPDGKQFATIVKNRGEFSIARWDEGKFSGWLRGKDPRQLVWSRDGKSLLFNTGPYDHSTLWETSAEGCWSDERIQELVVRCLLEMSCMEKELPPLQPRGEGDAPARSRDGHLALVRYHGKFEVWLQRASDKEPVKLPSPEIAHPVWSPDGRWIAGVAGDGQGSWVWALELSHADKGFRKLAKVGQSEFAFSPDSASIAFLRQLPPDGPPPLPTPSGHSPRQFDRYAIARISISSGEEKDLLVPLAPCTYQTLAWSKGGLFTNHRCYPPGAPAFGYNEIRVFDVQ